MSTHSAIAAVTATLHRRLREALQVTGLNADVSHTRPGTTNAFPNKVGVHLYLYMVTPNAALRNVDLPTRDDRGRIVGRPTVALELHYLLSFVGDEALHEPQRMLGAVAIDLHANPVLTPDEIRLATQATPELAGSRLEQQIERVRLTTEAINLEEFSKLWSVLFQTQYLLSAAYKASVVLLEADVEPPVPARVRDRGVWVAPLPPKISSISPQLLGAGALMVIRGAKLLGEPTIVRFVHEHGSVREVSPALLRDDRIELNLPSDLRAGIVSVQVVTRHVATSGSLPPRTFELESELVPFMLAPRIVQVPGSETLGELVAAAGDAVVVNVTPAIASEQDVQVHVGSVRVQPSSVITTNGLTELTFTVPNDPALVPGEAYPLRVGVDRAVSLIEDDELRFKPRLVVGGP